MAPIHTLNRGMITVTDNQKKLADSIGKMFSYAVDVLGYDNKYFLSMLTETDTSQLFENSSFICSDFTISMIVKQVINEMTNEEVTEPFRYNFCSDAYTFGYILCLYQQAAGLSYVEIEQILNSM